MVRERIPFGTWAACGAALGAGAGVALRSWLVRRRRRNGRPSPFPERPRMTAARPFEPSRSGSL